MRNDHKSDSAKKKANKESLSVSIRDRSQFKQKNKYWLLEKGDI